MRHREAVGELTEDSYDLGRGDPRSVVAAPEPRKVAAADELHRDEAVAAGSGVRGAGVEHPDDARVADGGEHDRFAEPANGIRVVGDTSYGRFVGRDAAFEDLHRVLADDLVVHAVDLGEIPSPRNRSTR